MGEYYFFKVFNLLVGVVGLAIAIGLILAPKTVETIEKKLDKQISTEKLEQALNKRKNLSQALMMRPKLFGLLFLLVSLLLVLSSMYVF